MKRGELDTPPRASTSSAPPVLSPTQAEQIGAMRAMPNNYVLPLDLVIVPPGNCDTPPPGG